jgi:hypothetical protein
MWTAIFASYVNDNATRIRFWKEDSVAYNLVFTLHHVLSVDRFDPASSNETPLIVNETIRLALMVFLGDAATRLGVSGVPETRHRQKIREFLLRHPVNWSPFSDLHLWILVVCAVEQHHATVEWLWYLGEIKKLMLQLGLSDSSTVMNVVKRFIWIDDVAVLGTEALAAGVDGLLEDNLGTDPSPIDL